MKKIVSIVVCLALLFSLCITANAASGTATLNGNNSVVVGNEIVLTVKISGCADATSVSANVSFSDNFEYESAAWLKAGSINNPYDTRTGKGALGGLTAPNVNGDLYRLTLKAKSASASNQTVSIIITAKNGGTEIFNATASKSIKINCASHSYGAYSKVNDSQHKRTCTACGNVETKNHTWNAGTVTKPADCKNPGNKKYECTLCSAEKNEAITKTNNHSFGSWSETKKPGCTTTGTQSRTCSVCNKVETRTVKATGHSFSAWSVTKKATCTAKGTETRTCSVCNTKENRGINALGHKFSNPTITKQPTCTETGVESGKCTRCGQTTTNTLKAKGHRFGAWSNVKEATCTAKGIEERQCSVCNTKQTRDINVLGHDFDNPIVVKEATISSTGLMEGKCKRCGETTSEIIPCQSKDEATGIVFEAQEGVFAAGAEIAVKSIAQADAAYESVKNSLADISSVFKAFDISAVLNGAAVQPNGKVKATFALPEGFSDDVAVYVIGADGTAEMLEAVINAENKTISVELEQLSPCALVDLENGKDTNANAGIQNIPVYTWIIAAAAVIIIAAGVVVMIVIKKRKNYND